MSKIDDVLYKAMCSKTIGRWCAVFWSAVVVTALLMALVTLLIGLAGKVGWILAVGIGILAVMGVSSIFMAMMYVGETAEEKWKRKEGC